MLVFHLLGIISSLRILVRLNVPFNPGVILFIESSTAHQREGAQIKLRETLELHALSVLCKYQVQLSGVGVDSCREREQLFAFVLEEPIPTVFSFEIDPRAQACFKAADKRALQGQLSSFDQLRAIFSLHGTLPARAARALCYDWHVRAPRARALRPFALLAGFGSAQPTADPLQPRGEAFVQGSLSRCPPSLPPTRTLTRKQSVGKRQPKC